MAPTPGRIVLYLSPTHGELPAVVLRAGTDGTPLREWVDLEVFGLDADARLVTHVRERQEYDEPCTWWWPPRV